jgi:hypothetical protein
MSPGSTGQRERLCRVGLLLACGLWLAATACRRGPTGAGHAGGGAAGQEVFEYSADKLSGLAAYLPPLDDGRLRVAPPIQWQLRPRSEAYVARFVLDPRVALPRITVEVTDADFPQPVDLTREDLLEFAQRIALGMDESTRQSLMVDVQPLVLGRVPCVRYVVHLRLKQDGKTFRAERETIATLAGGRIYQVVLDVFAGKLDDYRADAFAVMAGMEFLVPEASHPAEDLPDEDRLPPEPLPEAGEELGDADNDRP